MNRSFATKYDTKEARAYAAEQATRERNQLASGLRKTRLIRGFGMDNLETEYFQSAMNRLKNSVALVKKGEKWLRWASGMLVVICGALVFCLMGFKILMSPDKAQSLTAASARPPETATHATTNGIA